MAMSAAEWIFPPSIGGAKNTVGLCTSPRISEKFSVKTLQAAWLLRVGSAARGGDGNRGGECASYLQCGGVQKTTGRPGQEWYGSGWWEKPNRGEAC
jgi:hypothetical protein